MFSFKQIYDKICKLDSGSSQYTPPSKNLDLKDVVNTSPSTSSGPIDQVKIFIRDTEDTLLRISGVLPQLMAAMFLYTEKTLADPDVDTIPTVFDVGLIVRSMIAMGKFLDVSSLDPYVDAIRFPWQWVMSGGDVAVGVLIWFRNEIGLYTYDPDEDIEEPVFRVKLNTIREAHSLDDLINLYSNEILDSNYELILDDHGQAISIGQCTCGTHFLQTFSGRRVSISDVYENMLNAYSTQDILNTVNTLSLGSPDGVSLSDIMESIRDHVETDSTNVQNLISSIKSFGTNVSIGTIMLLDQEFTKGLVSTTVSEQTTRVVWSNNSYSVKTFNVTAMFGAAANVFSCVGTMLLLAARGIGAIIGGIITVASAVGNSIVSAIGALEGSSIYGTINPLCGNSYYAQPVYSAVFQSGGMMHSRLINCVSGVVPSKICTPLADFIVQYAPDGVSLEVTGFLKVNVDPFLGSQHHLYAGWTESPLIGAASSTETTMKMKTIADPEEVIEDHPTNFVGLCPVKYYYGTSQSHYVSFFSSATYDDPVASGSESNAFAFLHADQSNKKYSEDYDAGLSLNTVCVLNNAEMTLGLSPQEIDRQMRDRICKSLLIMCFSGWDWKAGNVSLYFEYGGAVKCANGYIKADDGAGMSRPAAIYCWEYITDAWSIEGQTSPKVAFFHLLQRYRQMVTGVDAQDMALPWEDIVNHIIPMLAEGRFYLLDNEINNPWANYLYGASVSNYAVVPMSGEHISFYLTPPSYSASYVTGAITVTLATSLAVIATACLGKFIIKRALKKQAMTAVNAASSANSAFKENPTSDNYKLLKKASLKANLLCSLGGFGKYDMMADFFESSTGGSVIAALGATFSSAENTDTGISDTQASVNNVGSSVSNVGSRVDGVQSSVDNVRSGVSSVASSVSEVGDSVDRVSTKVSSVESSLSDISTTVSDISENLLMLKSLIKN